MQPSVCPDCPATRRRTLTVLLPAEGARCALRCRSVAAREPLPSTWFGAYGLALVRRGVVVRQRVDADGSQTAIDALGAGSAMPLSEGGDALDAGYAATDALLCLYPRRLLRAAIAGAPTSASIVDLYAAALDRVERIALARSRPTALARVAALLATLADTLSPPERLALIPAALQQRDMAALLSMRHESVCRAVQSLARLGAVARTDSGLRLLDRAKLAEACAR